MSHDLQWIPDTQRDPDLEHFRGLTNSSAAFAAEPSISHLQDFASVIENVIVPRLLMNHAQEEREIMMRRSVISNQTISDFIVHTMDDRPEAAVNFVSDLLSQGVPFRSILLNLMAPAARELGERWENDSTSFVEVTLGVARMHRILREFDGVPDHLWSQEGQGRHILLLPAPGENHSFGLRLVQEFLLRESWTVSNKPVEDNEALGILVAQDYYDVAGLSLSGETLIETCVSAIECIRTKSRNPHVKIIVGGQLFAERPELVELCGADAYGYDAPSCVAIVNNWARALSLVS
jgi:MerR family transcriptional regulator, light-induced transcriptional regulator